MIFFGKRGKTVEGQLISGMNCPNCDHSQFMSFGVLNYFHLYWIPTILTSRNVGVECTNCKNTLVDDELPAAITNQIKAAVFKTTDTVLMFSGLIIISLLIVFVLYESKQDDLREAAYIEQPAVNDFYVVDFTKTFVEADAEYKYGVLRITKISSDEITFQVSNFVYTLASGAESDIRDGEASSDSYYDGEPFSIEISGLAEMKTDGAIHSVERK